MEENNGKNGINEKVATNTANIRAMKEDIEDIKIQVSNHIPTSIKELGDKIDKVCEKSDEKYAAKWVEKLITYTVLTILTAVLVAGLSLIIISNK